MSKFRIYRENTSDPKSISRQNKKLIIAFSGLLVIVYLVLCIDSQINKNKVFAAIYYSVLIIFVILAGIILFIIRKQSKNLKDIGILEFRKSSIKKEIGDLNTIWLYDDISSIEIEKYLRAMTVFSSESGASTYIIRIKNRNAIEDNFIISYRSVDFGQKKNIIDTLKALKAIAGVNFNIKKN